MDWLLATGSSLLRLNPEGRVIGAQPAPALCVCRHPREPRLAFAGLQDGGVLRTLDGGRTWAPLGAVPDPVFSIAVSPWDGSVYAGCEPSALFKWVGAGTAGPADGSGPERLQGLDHLPSRPGWSFPPRPWTSHVRWIAPAPDGPALVCGIELGGVLYSPDGGATWLDQRPGAHADCHALAWPASDWVWEAAGGGVAVSRDGAAWRRCDDGLDRTYVWGLAVDPGDPATAFVSASPGPGAAHHRDGHADAAIYRRRGDQPWRRLSGTAGTGLPERFDHLPVALAPVPGEPGHVAAWLRDGQVWETLDSGQEWARLRGSLPGTPSVLAAVAVDAG